MRERLAMTGVAVADWRCECIGIDSVDRTGAAGAEPREVRVRMTARTRSMAEAIRIGGEVEALYTNGPAGGGGVTRRAREILAVGSVLIDRDAVRPRFEMATA